MIADLYVKSPEELDLDKDGDVEYVMMEGQMGHQDAIIRTEWSIKTIRSAGVPLKAVESGVANFDRSQGAALMEQWLQKGDDIELVICNNDEMALGAVDAIEKMGIKKDIKIVGIDGIADGIQAVKEGKMCIRDSHSNNQIAFGIVQSCHQGIMLSKVAGRCV